jgi:hypothetical protein
VHVDGAIGVADRGVRVRFGCEGAKQGSELLGGAVRKAVRDADRVERFT